MLGWTAIAAVSAAAVAGSVYGFRKWKRAMLLSIPTGGDTTEPTMGAQ